MYAFIFTVFWAIYHRMWRFALLLLLLNAGVAGALYAADVLFPPTTNICQIGLQLWVGFVANDFMRTHLQRQGFITYALVSGENELRAEQRFFDQNAPRLNSEAVKPLHG